MIKNNTFGDSSTFKVLDYLAEKINEDIKNSKNYISFIDRLNKKISDFNKALLVSDENQKILLIQYTYYKQKEFINNLKLMKGRKDIIDRLHNYTKAKFKHLREKYV